MKCGGVHIYAPGVFSGQRNVVLREVAAPAQAQGGEKIFAQLDSLLPRPGLVRHEELGEADHERTSIHYLAFHGGKRQVDEPPGELTLTKHLHRT